MSGNPVSNSRSSTWNDTDLESPPLNISIWAGKPKGPFAYEDRLYDYEYFSTNDNAICQPVQEGNQQAYQWGFSILQLEMTLCLLALWTFGIYTAWATAHLRLASMGTAYKSPGNIQSTMSLADAVRKEFKEQNEKDANVLTKRELASYIKTDLGGGRVMVQSPPLVQRQSARKWIWMWVMANKGWTIAFALVSLSMVFYALTILIWLTMIFSVVAGWGRKTRYFVFFLSLVSGGFLPAGYLVVIFVRKRFNGLLGSPISSTSQTG